MIKIDLPVYWQVSRNKKIFIGMNWYQRADKYEINKVKQEFQNFVKLKLIKNKEKIKGEYEINYKYFYKRSDSDLKNVTSVVDKFLNDALQEIGIVENDNVKYFKKSIDEVGNQDKENPRVETFIKKKQNNMDIKTEIMSNLEDVEYIIKRYDEMKEFYKKENIEMDSLEFYKGKRQALIDILGESQKER